MPGSLMLYKEEEEMEYKTQFLLFRLEISDNEKAMRELEVLEQQVN